MAAAELWPVAKVGGLGDAVAFLSKALGRLGHDVRCALPRYRLLDETLPSSARVIEWREIGFPLRGERTQAWVSHVEGSDLPAPLLLVDHEVFDRPGVYDDPDSRSGYPDNGLRWAVFCRALHGALAEGEWEPDIVHAHDHQAALLLGVLRWARAAATVARRPGLVFTIHNLGYQGIENRGWLADSGLPEAIGDAGGPLEYFGRVNLMKLGLEAADRLTTVSPRYAEEIRTSAEFGAGLEGILSRRADRLTGILNGVDTETWNPATDPHIPFRYSASWLAGKTRNREALRAELGLEAPEPDVPVLAFIGRLASQKGLDLLIGALGPLLEDGLQVVALGTGEEQFERALREVAGRWPGRFALRIAFDEPLAHRIEAGADVFLMPSRYEPCGLNQMYSLRYGTVPVVRAVGGLADTVVDVGEDTERGNGFVFRLYDSAELLETVRRAARAWRDRKLWWKLIARGMASDFSWDASARRYAEVYEQALRDRASH